MEIATLGSLHAELDKCRRELKTKTNQLENLEGANHRLEVRLKDLQRDVAAATDAKLALQRQQLELDAALKERAKEGKEKDARLANAQAELHRAQRALKEADGASAGLRRALCSLEAEVAERRGQATAAQQQVGRLQSSLAGAQASLRTATEHGRELQGRVELLEGVLKQKEDELLVQQARLRQEMKKDAAALAKQFEEERAKLKRLESEHEAALAKSAAALHAKDSALADLQLRLDRAVQELQCLRGQASAVAARGKRSESERAGELQAAQRTATDLLRRLQQAEATTQEATEQAAQERRKRCDAEAEAATLRRDRDAAQQAAQELARLRDAAVEDLLKGQDAGRQKEGEHSEQASQLRRLLGEEKAERSRLQQELATTAAAMAQLRAEKEALEWEMAHRLTQQDREATHRIALLEEQFDLTQVGSEAALRQKEDRERSLAEQLRGREAELEVLRLEAQDLDAQLAAARAELARERRAAAAVQHTAAAATEDRGAAAARREMEWEARCAALENEAATLRTRLAGERAERTQELDGLKQRLADLQLAADTQRKELGEALLQAAAAEKKATELERARDRLKMELETAKEEAVRMKSRSDQAAWASEQKVAAEHRLAVQRLEEQLRHARDEMDVLELERQALRRDADGLAEAAEGRLAALRLEAERAAEALQHSRQGEERALGDLADARLEARRLAAQLEQAEAARGELERALEAQRVALAQQAERCGGAEQALGQRERALRQAEAAAQAEAERQQGCIAALERQVADLSDAKNRCEELISTMTALKKSLQNAEEEREAAASRSDSKDRRAKAAEALNECLTTKVKEREAELATLRAYKEQRQRHLSDVERRITVVLADLRAGQQERLQLRRQLCGREAELITLRQTLHEGAEVKRVLQRHAKEVEETLAVLQRRLCDVQAEASAVRETHAAEVQQAYSRLREVDQQLAAVHAQHATAAAAAAQQARTQSEEAAALRAQLAAATAQCQRLQADLEETARQLAEQRSELSTARTQYATVAQTSAQDTQAMAQESAALQAEVAAATAALEEKARQLAELQGQLTAVEAAASEAAARHAEALEERAALEAELAAATASVEEKSQQVEEQQNQLAAVHAQHAAAVAAAEQQAEAQAEEAAALRAQLAAAAAQCHPLQTALEETARQLAEKHSELESVRAELYEMAAKVADSESAAGLTPEAAQRLTEADDAARQLRAALADATGALERAVVERDAAVQAAHRSGEELAAMAAMAAEQQSTLERLKKLETQLQVTTGLLLSSRTDFQRVVADRDRLKQVVLEVVGDAAAPTADGFNLESAVLTRLREEREGQLARLQDERNFQQAERESVQKCHRQLQELVEQRQRSYSSDTDPLSLAEAQVEGFLATLSATITAERQQLQARLLGHTPGMAAADGDSEDSFLAEHQDQDATLASVAEELPEALPVIPEPCTPAAAGKRKSDPTSTPSKDAKKSRPSLANSPARPPLSPLPTPNLVVLSPPRSARKCPATPGSATPTSKTDASARKARRVTGVLRSLR